MGYCSRREATDRGPRSPATSVLLSESHEMVGTDATCHPFQFVEADAELGVEKHGVSDLRVETIRTGGPS